MLTTFAIVMLTVILLIIMNIVTIFLNGESELNIQTIVVDILVLLALIVLALISTPSFVMTSNGFEYDECIDEWVKKVEKTCNPEEEVVE